jgi:uncharacterized protein YjdB
MSLVKIDCSSDSQRIVKERLALHFGFGTRVDGNTLYVTATSAEKLGDFVTRYCVDKRIKVTVINDPLYTYGVMHPHTVDPAATGRSWFKATELASVYAFPTPSSAKVVVGVISFGGGLFGTLNGAGVLTGGDVQAYWAYCGIAPANMPTVVVVPIGGATNSPSTTDGATDENTLDVETIGACCPTSNLTIIMYIAPNTLSAFGSVFTYALNTAVTVNGVAVKPSILSVSWGAPEIYYSNLSTIDSIFASAVSKGVNICTATGDNGSNDGVGGSGSYCDFPSSSPNVIACGGTNLVCPNNTYDSATRETAWSSGGGAVSASFAKPAYQSAFTGSYRSIPDIASNADPNTGVVYIVGGNYVVYGGTSVAAPTVAGYLACLNTTSFINPTLYSVGTAYFNDILTGSNGAFTAKTGYDNCTGLGSVKGSSLGPLLLGTQAVTGLSLNASTATLRVGATYQLVATITPANASNKNITWNSSATGVATVSASGLIRGISNGTATITATTVSGSFVASVTVTVTTAVTGVTLSSSSLSLRPAGTAQLTATVVPSGASNKAVTWASSNTGVASVSNGLVTAVANGSATVTVTTADGGFRSSTTVTVSTPVTGVTLNSATLTIRKNQTYQFLATVAPSGAGNKSVTWSSSNTSRGTISATGLLTAKATGSLTITVRTADGGFSASCVVTVTP